MAACAGDVTFPVADAPPDTSPVRAQAQTHPVAVVIEDMRENARRHRPMGITNGRSHFARGILAFHPRHVELCGEGSVEKNRKGQA